MHGAGINLIQKVIVRTTKESKLMSEMNMNAGAETTPEISQSLPAAEEALHAIERLVLFIDTHSLKMQM